MSLSIWHDSEASKRVLCDSHCPGEGRGKLQRVRRSHRLYLGDLNLVGGTATVDAAGAAQYEVMHVARRVRIRDELECDNMLLGIWERILGRRDRTTPRGV